MRPNADPDMERSAKITNVSEDEGAAHLQSNTQYEVQVRAKNDEGTSEWSSVGRARTGAGNIRPNFDRTDTTLITLRVDENTRAGQNIGSAVSATDADSNRLTYSLEGPGANSFAIVSGSGQIRTKAPLDYEPRRVLLSNCQGG